VRRELKTLAGALAIFLLAVGLVACGGGGDDSGSTSAEAAGQTTSESPSSSKPSGDENKAGKEGHSEASRSEGDEAAGFVPKHHNDSGGGAAQYKEKGGDNSVQEFGDEAESGEFEAVAVALHNFLDARAEQNWAATCDYIAANLIESFEKLSAQAKQLEDKSCAGVLEKLVNPAAKGLIKAEAEQADVRSVRIEGDRAFVIYTATDGAVMLLPMVSEDGAWKASSLAGSPLG